MFSFSLWTLSTFRKHSGPSDEADFQSKGKILDLGTESLSPCINIWVWELRMGVTTCNLMSKTISSHEWCHFSSCPCNSGSYWGWQKPQLLLITVTLHQQPCAAFLKLQPWNHHDVGELQRRAGWDEGGLCVAAATLSQGLCRGSQDGEEHLPLSHALCSKPSLHVMSVVAQTELFRPLPCSQAPILSISRQPVFNLTFPFWLDLSWKSWKGRAPSCSASSRAAGR